ncbi:hypothetical protein NDU88_002197 [Pleurodeles waltl]|uniref:Uncharacterized protein n=1 Tax=Pleurodeles waltl TaxID=8319 RepID=A0AAV7UWJ5_PLEWA|nr:hypothetical protein NDU88_002197 [Pleurodeles waltl]
MALRAGSETDTHLGPRVWSVTQGTELTSDNTSGFRNGKTPQRPQRNIPWHNNGRDPRCVDTKTQLMSLRSAAVP